MSHTLHLPPQERLPFYEEEAPQTQWEAVSDTVLRGSPVEVSSDAPDLLNADELRDDPTAGRGVRAMLTMGGEELPGHVTLFIQDIRHAGYGSSETGVGLRLADRSILQVPPLTTHILRSTDRLNLAKPNFVPLIPGQVFEAGRNVDSLPLGDVTSDAISRRNTGIEVFADGTIHIAHLSEANPRTTSVRHQVQRPVKKPVEQAAPTPSSLPAERASIDNSGRRGQLFARRFRGSGPLLIEQVSGRPRK